MSKHTAGPWLADFYTNTGGFFIYVDGQSGTRTICSRGQWLHRKDESEANARLIAAAPDLLLALSNFCAGYEADEVHEGHYKTALAAIAKATGTTP